MFLCIYFFWTFYIQNHTVFSDYFPSLNVFPRFIHVTCQYMLTLHLKKWFEDRKQEWERKKGKEGKEKEGETLAYLLVNGHYVHSWSGARSRTQNSIQVSSHGLHLWEVGIRSQEPEPRVKPKYFNVRHGYLNWLLKKNKKNKKTNVTSLLNFFMLLIYITVYSV